MLKKSISLILSLSLIITQPIFAQGLAQLNLAQYLGQARPAVTDIFRPAQLRYFSYNNLNNSFRILLDKGDLKDIKDNQLKDQAKELMDYFLIGVTLPNDAFWVNLRPDSPDNIIDPELEKTGLGKILLEADLQLKKDTASLTSPQTPEGKAYWDKLYKKAGELFGTENITIPTLTRPWIVPGEIIVRESGTSAYIYKATLKVMLEADYLKGYQPSDPNYPPLTSNYSFSDPRLKELNEYSSQIIRESIIPKLTQEVNSSQRYAKLRQVYYSLVLSRWFKMRFSGQSGQYASLINKHDLTNLTSKEPYDKLTYFKQYQESFAQGEYNLKEPVYTPYGQSIRSYMSGGFSATNIKFSGPGTKTNSSPAEQELLNTKGMVILNESLEPQPLALAASPLTLEYEIGAIGDAREALAGLPSEIINNKHWWEMFLTSLTPLSELLEIVNKIAKGYSEFLTGDLYILELRKALGNNSLASEIVREELRALGVSTVNTASKEKLLIVFNNILRDRYFPKKIDGKKYESLIHIEIEPLLKRALWSNSELAGLDDLDYCRINRELLGIIYPREIRQTYALVSHETAKELLNDILPKLLRIEREVKENMERYKKELADFFGGLSNDRSINISADEKERLTEEYSKINESNNIDYILDAAEEANRLRIYRSTKTLKTDKGKDATASLLTAEQFVEQLQQLSHEVASGTTSALEAFKSILSALFSVQDKDSLISGRNIQGNVLAILEKVKTTESDVYGSVYYEFSKVFTPDESPRFTVGKLIEQIKYSLEHGRNINMLKYQETISEMISSYELWYETHNPRVNRRIVFLGPPGAGKGTHAAKFAEQFGLAHISTGDLLRQEVARKTDLGNTAKEYITAGQLVPDDIVQKILIKRLTQDDAKNSFILDGYPRNEEQAKALDSLLEEKGLFVDLVVDLQARDEIIIERISGRRVCRICGATYHILNIPPKVEGICDKDGGELYQRRDDNKETVRERILVYNQATKPLIAYYLKQRKLHSLDANGAQSVVLGEIIKTVREHDVNAIKQTVKDLSVGVSQNEWENIKQLLEKTGYDSAEINKRSEGALAFLKAIEEIKSLESLISGAASPLGIKLIDNDDKYSNLRYVEDEKLSDLTRAKLWNSFQSVASDANVEDNPEYSWGFAVELNKEEGIGRVLGAVKYKKDTETEPVTYVFGNSSEDIKNDITVALKAKTKQKDEVAASPIEFHNEQEAEKWVKENFKTGSISKDEYLLIPNEDFIEMGELAKSIIQTIPKEIDIFQASGKMAYGIPQTNIPLFHQKNYTIQPEVKGKPRARSISSEDWREVIIDFLAFIVIDDLDSLTTVSETKKLSLEKDAAIIFGEDGYVAFRLTLVQWWGKKYLPGYKLKELTKKQRFFFERYFSVFVSFLTMPEMRVLGLISAQDFIVKSMMLELHKIDVRALFDTTPVLGPDSKEGGLRSILESCKKYMLEFPEKYIQATKIKISKKEIEEITGTLTLYFDPWFTNRPENVAIAAGYLSRVMRDKFEEGVIAEGFRELQGKINSIVENLINKSNENKALSVITLDKLILELAVLKRETKSHSAEEWFSKLIELMSRVNEKDTEFKCEILDEIFFILNYRVEINNIASYALNSFRNVHGNMFNDYEPKYPTISKVLDAIKEGLKEDRLEILRQLEFVNWKNEKLKISLQKDLERIEWFIATVTSAQKNKDNSLKSKDSASPLTETYVVDNEVQRKIENIKYVIKMFPFEAREFIAQTRNPKFKEELEELYQETNNKITESREANDIIKASEAVRKFYSTAAGIQFQESSIAPEVSKKLVELEEVGLIIDAVVKKMKDLIEVDMTELEEVILNKQDIDFIELESIIKELSLNNLKSAVLEMKKLFEDSQPQDYEKYSKKWSGIKSELAIFDINEIAPGGVEMRKRYSTASPLTNEGYVVNDADREIISGMKEILNRFLDDGKRLIVPDPHFKALYEETKQKLQIYWKTEETYDIQKAFEATLEFYRALTGFDMWGKSPVPEIENKIQTLWSTDFTIKKIVEKLKSLIEKDIKEFRKKVNTEVDPNELDELKRELSLKNSKATVTYILFSLSDQFKPYHNIPGFFIEESKKRYNGIKNELKIFDFPVASSALFLSDEEKLTITDIKKKIDSFPRAYAEWRLKSKHQEQFFSEMIRYRSADINQAGNDLELVISKIKSFLNDSKVKDEQFGDEGFAIPELKRLEALIKGINSSITNKMREEFKKLSIEDESKVKEFNAFLEKNWLAAAADYVGNVILRDSNDASAKEWRQLVKDIVFYRLGTYLIKSSSSITSELETGVFQENPLGGIDFTDRAMRIGLEPMGSFADLKLVLPEISNVAAIDLDNEFKQIQVMASAGIRPADIRILEFAAACYYRGEFSPRLGEITACLQQAHFLDERLGRESSPTLRLATMLPEVLYSSTLN